MPNTVYTAVYIPLTVDDDKNGLSTNGGSRNKAWTVHVTKLLGL